MVLTASRPVVLDALTCLMLSHRFGNQEDQLVDIAPMVQARAQAQSSAQPV